MSMKKALYMVMALAVAAALALAGCEHLQGAPKRVTDDLKKTGKKIEKKSKEVRKDMGKQ
jgi:predicted small secreted protein